MSYSVGNVLIEAGVDNILRWLPYDISKDEVCDILRNKMIRPTSIPCTLEELWLEQAVCREALRLSLIQHRCFAVSISRGGSAGGISSVFKQKARRYQLVNPMQLDVVIGSGGVLSHAPSRLAAALMMIEGFSLSGITELCVDSIFMMPHLGVFSAIHRKAALEIFHSDCIVPVAVGIVPLYTERVRERELAELYVNGNLIGTVKRGMVQHIAAPLHQIVEVEVRPKAAVDIGGGVGVSVRRKVNTGLAGFILDGRSAPLFQEYFTVKNNKELYSSLGLDKV
jgi:MutL protein